MKNQLKKRNITPSHIVKERLKQASLKTKRLINIHKIMVKILIKFDFSSFSDHLNYVKVLEKNVDYKNLDKIASYFKIKVQPITKEKTNFSTPCSNITEEEAILLSNLFYLYNAYSSNISSLLSPHIKKTSPLFRAVREVSNHSNFINLMWLIDDVRFIDKTLSKKYGYMFFGWNDIKRPLRKK